MTSHGSGKFSQNLRASKNFWYIERNYKSGQHGWRHTFMQHKSRTKRTSTDNSKPELKVKSRKKGLTKPSPPQRQYWMLCPICCCKNRHNKNKKDQYILSYDDFDLCNDYISKEHHKNDRFCIICPRHCVRGHILSDFDPLDDVDSWRDVVQSTKKPRCVDPRKLKPIQIKKETTNNKKIHQ